MEFYHFIQEIMPYILGFTAPILITATGGLFSERSGVVNIGLEGLMVVGTFTSAIFVKSMVSVLGVMPQYMVWVSILLAALVGGLFSLLHAYASVSLKADQVISGTAINLLAPAITLFLAEGLIGTQNITLPVGLKRYDNGIPLLSKIPFIGELFFTSVNLSIYFVLLIVILAWFIIFKTSYGLRLRACGENPHAADSMGVNVVRMRYQAVFISGVLAGIGGAIFVLTYPLEFNGLVNGLGFLALASLIFGKWRPFNVLGATLFFGGMSTLATFSQVNETIKSLQLPREAFNIIPFIATIIALLVFSRNSNAPKALGEPYDTGKR
ncbi:ABC transporter permease [Mycoplasmatota bacterium]|nr:ABC transporter permease [Mycoplasmatota bacterium]